MPKHLKGKIIENYCNDCPFFNNGVGYEYQHHCRAGGSSGDNICVPTDDGWGRKVTKIPRDCPLRAADEGKRQIPVEDNGCMKGEVARDWGRRSGERL